MTDQTEAEQTRTLARILSRLIVGNDIDRARRGMRWAWMTGFIWTALSFMGAVVGIVRLASANGEGPVLGLIILGILEVGLVAYLSYGLLQRRRTAATVLFFYFWISRVVWIGVGQIGLQSTPEIANFLLVQVLPAVMFFHGMRGAWTYFYLTHPQYPGAESRQE